MSWRERVKGVPLLIAGLGSLTYVVNHQIQEYRRNVAAHDAFVQCIQQQYQGPIATRSYDNTRCLKLADTPIEGC